MNKIKKLSKSLFVFVLILNFTVLGHPETIRIWGYGDEVEGIIDVTGEADVNSSGGNGYVIDAAGRKHYITLKWENYPIALLGYDASGNLQCELFNAKEMEERFGQYGPDPNSIR